MEVVCPPEKRRENTKKVLGNKVVDGEGLSPCEAVGESVYDVILPSSFLWKSGGGGGGVYRPQVVAKRENPDEDHVDMAEEEMKASASELVGIPMMDEEYPEVMPFINYLQNNSHLEPGWHRKAERLSRGIHPPKSLATQLEAWEKQLAILEVALLTGVAVDPQQQSTGSSGIGVVAQHYKHLAHAWGREQNFHRVLVEKVCSRRGDYERKTRSDMGVKMSNERKMQMKQTKEEVAKKRRLEQEEALVDVEEYEAMAGDGDVIGEDVVVAAGYDETALDTTVNELVSSEEATAV